MFLKNSPLINKWNKEGLISSKINGDTATQLFTSGKAAYWVTGPWNIDTARKAGINFKIVQVPKIKCNAVPFLGVQGLMVTKYASGHGVATAAKDFVANYMAGAGPQATLAAANNRYPGEHGRRQARHRSGAEADRPRQQGRRADAEHPRRWLPSGATSAMHGSSRPRAPAQRRPPRRFKTAAKNIRAKIAGG